MYSKLRYRLTVLLIGLSVISMIAVVTVIASRTYNDLIDSSFDELTSAGLHGGDLISTSINERINELTLLGDVYNFSQLPLPEQTSLLNNMLVARNFYEQIAVLDLNGQERLRVARFDIVFEEDLFDYSSSDFLQTILTTRAVQISDIVVSQQTGEPLLRIGVPFFDLRRGTINAVIIADFRFRVVWDIMADLQSKITRPISVFLTDTTGNLIAHANPSVVLRNIVFEFPERHGETQGLDDMPAFTVVSELSIANTTFLIVAQETVNAALQPVFEMLRNSAIVTVVALIIVIAVVIAVVARIVEPIENLAGVAKSLGQGDFAVRAKVAGRDEIGDLGRVFNEMAEAIEYRDKVQIVKLEKQLVEIEEARNRAERADQVKSSFLASMSHELRTPLNAVINFTRFVIDGDVGPVTEQQIDLLTEVVGSAKHLLNLINDVLDMSKIESESLNLFVEDNIDLESLLKSSATTGQSLIADKPVNLQVAIEESLPLVRGDKQRLFQIFLNVVSNACKFTEEGEIVIRAHQEGEEIIVSVSDTGPGITPEDQEMVFEAFKQTSTGLRQGGGTGLGMPIARSLAEAHGGRLWLQSEYGKGAVFYIAIPIKADELVPV